jgi:hypothetical protein
VPPIAVDRDPEGNDTVFAGATSVLLPVAHQRQTQSGCSTDNWCCGLASVNMATAYLWGVAPTAAYLSKETALLGLNSCCHKLSNPSSKGTNVYDQARVAREVGNAKSSQAACFTFDSLKTYLRAGYPVPVSLVYGNVPAPYTCLSTFKGRHSVLLVGFNETSQTWTVNDPLCSAGQRVWSSSVFRSALSAAGVGSCQIMGVFVAK